MIKVSYKEKDGIIEKVEILGHAGYSESGKDIVCAAVSATFLTTINAVNVINEEVITYSIKDGDAVVSLVKSISDNSIINLILFNMINQFKELERDYPKYIEIRRC